MSEDEMIATLSSISGESDLEACRARLAAHGFDLEAAVNDALGVSAPPPPPPPPPPSGPRRRRRATMTTTTTRPVPFRSNNDVVGGILSIPFRIVFAVAGAALRVAGGVLSAVLPASITRRVRALPPVTIGGEIDDPVVAAAAFIADFNDKYVRDDDDDAGASSAPAFLPCSHADALREAKRAIKFLFVYLHAPEHEDTDEFCVKTLCDARVVAFLEEHALAWGGDVTTSDAFRLAGVAGVRPSAYPYVALLQNAEGASGPELVMACEGAIDPVGLLEVMMTAIAEQGDVVEAARARRTEARFFFRFVSFRFSPIPRFQPFRRLIALSFGPSLSTDHRRAPLTSLPHFRSATKRGTFARSKTRRFSRRWRRTRSASATPPPRGKRRCVLSHTSSHTTAFAW
jgi:FAS-associated factor 2